VGRFSRTVRVLRITPIPLLAGPGVRRLPFPGLRLAARQVGAQRRRQPHLPRPSGLGRDAEGACFAVGTALGHASIDSERDGPPARPGRTAAAGRHSTPRRCHAAVQNAAARPPRAVRRPLPGPTGSSLRPATPYGSFRPLRGSTSGSPRVPAAVAQCTPLVRGRTLNFIFKIKYL
jgi:hypothetical protein